jgi:hypothetical protein
VLALDFSGAVEDVLPQPFTPRFRAAGGGFREHVPDFLAVFRDGSRWLLDVRPARLVREDDTTCFAAAAEAALEAGWRYSVAGDWRPHVRTGIDALSARRRDLEDRLGLQDGPLDVVLEGPAAFGDLVGATPLPVVARAHALHLMWRRRLGNRPVPAGLRRVAGLAGRGERLMAGQAGLLELSAGRRCCSPCSAGLRREHRRGRAAAAHSCRVFGRIVPFLVAFAALALLVQPRVFAWLEEHPGSGGRFWPQCGLSAVWVFDGYRGVGAGVTALAVLAMTVDTDLARANALKGLSAGRQ